MCLESNLAQKVYNRKVQKVFLVVIWWSGGHLVVRWSFGCQVVVWLSGGHLVVRWSFGVQVVIWWSGGHLVVRWSFGGQVVIWWSGGHPSAILGRSRADILLDIF
jgi:hypothetical protein